MIPNPDYFEDSTPNAFTPIAAIGFELWTMQADILFDNIFIGDSLNEANDFAKSTFTNKWAAEKELQKIEKEAVKVENTDSTASIEKDFFEAIKSMDAQIIYEFLEKNPLFAFGFGVILAFPIVFFFLIKKLSSGDKKEFEQETTEGAEEEKEIKIQEIITSESVKERSEVEAVDEEEIDVE